MDCRTTQGREDLIDLTLHASALVKDPCTPVEERPFQGRVNRMD
jgi:hypothetical protein